MFLKGDLFWANETLLKNKMQTKSASVNLFFMLEFI
jgi:hypothetical protein